MPVPPLRTLAYIDVSAALLRELLRLPEGTEILDAVIPYPPFLAYGELPGVFRLTIAHPAIPALDQGAPIPEARAELARGCAALIRIDGRAIGGEALAALGGGNVRADLSGPLLAALASGAELAGEEEGER